MDSNGRDGDRPPEEFERDEPVAEIRELALAPSAGFADRLRRRIERQETSNHALWFSWHLPGAVLIAFLDMVFSLFGISPRDGGGLS